MRDRDVRLLKAFSDYYVQLKGHWVAIRRGISQPSETWPEGYRPCSGGSEDDFRFELYGVKCYLGFGLGFEAGSTMFRGVLEYGVIRPRWRLSSHPEERAIVKRLTFDTQGNINGDLGHANEFEAVHCSFLANNVKALVEAYYDVGEAEPKK